MSGYYSNLDYLSKFFINAAENKKEIIYTQIIKQSIRMNY